MIGPTVGSVGTSIGLITRRAHHRLLGRRPDEGPVGYAGYAGAPNRSSRNIERSNAGSRSIARSARTSPMTLANL